MPYTQISNLTENKNLPSTNTPAYFVVATTTCKKFCNIAIYSLMQFEKYFFFDIKDEEKSNWWALSYKTLFCTTNSLGCLSTVTFYNLAYYE
jgi:hypothetical protein